MEKSNRIKVVCAGGSVMAALLLGIVLCGCKPATVQNNGREPQSSEKNVAGSTDSVDVQSGAAGETAADEAGAGDAQSSERLTFGLAKTMVTPRQLYDEQAIAGLFAAMQLPEVDAERYIWDADFGGDSPAISYTWGEGVVFKNWEFKPTADNFYGVHFNFFFDKSRKTGYLKQLTVLTSDAAWYERFMAAAKAGGMMLKGDLDKAACQREGKEYVLNAGQNAIYFINDFSANGTYEVEFGYDNGIDI